MKIALTELRNIIKEVVLEELENEEDIFDIPLPVLRVEDIKKIPKNFTGIAKEPDGSKFWFKDGIEYIDDNFNMPVLRVHYAGDIPKNFTGIVIFNGTKLWFKDGKYHRKDGPAIEFSNGSKGWYKDGELHRENGPAIENNITGGKEYWLNNKRYSQEEYNRKISNMLKKSTSSK